MAKLSKYKVKTLYVTGRLTLIKSMLGSLPTFSMFLYNALIGILNTFEAMRNKFFLGVESEE